MNGIAFLDEADGAAGSGFRADMADSSTAGSTREAAISDEGHGLIQLHAGQSRGGVQHLPHTGAALGALVADDHHITGDDLTRVDGGNGGLLTVEDTGRAGVLLHLGSHGAPLDHAAVGSDVAPEDLQTTGLRIGILDGADGLFVEDVGTLDVLAEGLAGDGGYIQIQQTLLGQLCLHGGDAACGVEVGHMGGAGGGQVAEVGGPGADLIEEFQVDGHTGLVGDGQQVEHGIGGAAQCHIAGQGVPDGALIDDLTGGDALVDHVHDGHTGVLCQLQALGVDRRNGAVAGQGDADGLTQAIHAVGSVHTGAAAAGGAAVAGAVFQLRIGDHTGLVGTHGLEHLGEADFLAAVGTGQHGAAGADHSGHVHPDRSHDHAGDDLITVGHQNQAVQLMGHQHGLHAVADELTGGQAVLHAHMAHGDAVAHADGRDEDGGAACHLDAGLDGIGDLIQIHVAGHDLTVGAHHTDEGALQLFGGVAQGVKQASVGGALRAFGHVVTSHGLSSL